ncbi:uncharacterized [Tachysurus ichikawai]
MRDETERALAFQRCRPEGAAHVPGKARLPFKTRDVCGASQLGSVTRSAPARGELVPRRASRFISLSRHLSHEIFPLKPLVRG